MNTVFHVVLIDKPFAAGSGNSTIPGPGGGGNPLSFYLRGSKPLYARFFK